jgi:hypothetical protein
VIPFAACIRLAVSLRSKIPSTMTGKNTKFAFGTIVATAAVAVVIHYLPLRMMLRHPALHIICGLEGRPSSTTLAMKSFAVLVARVRKKQLSAL